MREARALNNSWLHSALNVDDPVSRINLDDPNPFIEDEHQKVTRIGYIYKVWKIQEAKAEIGQKEKKICIRC